MPPTAREQEIRRANIDADIAAGRTYRCQFCEEESPCADWGYGDDCPKCHRKYSMWMAMDDEG